MEKIQSYKINRVCSYKGCKTILSRYNKSKYCFAHQIRALDEKYDKKKAKDLPKSKGWHQVTIWSETLSRIMHGKDCFPKGCWKLCKRKVKTKNRGGITEYSIYGRIPKEKGVMKNV